MKRKKIVIISLIIVVFIIIAATIFFKIYNDKDRLSVQENQWLDNNKNNVISVNVINDLNIFGKDGKGIYFDFLNALSENYSIQINPVTYNTNEEVTGTSLGYSLDKNSIVSFYDDNFILVSKEEKIFGNLSNLTSTKIGIINNFKSYVESYINNQNNEMIGYNTKEELLNAFGNNELNFIIVPKMMYLDEILSKDYHIVYHISDAKIYYGVSKDNSELASIMSKYFTKWKEKYFDESFNENELELFINSLNIASADIDEIRANTYSYGSINNGPYEIISGGNFGGINAVYLKKFADLIDVKIDFVKYNKLEKLEKAVKNNKINIYFDYYSINTNLEAISTNMITSYVVAIKQNKNDVIKSLKSLNGEEVYVEADSKLYNYLESNTDLNLNTYKNDKELKKIVKKENIIIIDVNKYESYKNNILGDYIVRYKDIIDNTYKFKVTTNNTFNKLLNKYLETLDSNEMKYVGLNNYFTTKKSGTLLGTLAKYVLILLTIVIVIIIIIYKKSKKIKIAKKIKKEDKMKFIDQLTSLKNRNYLNENLENWNNNTIYPQAVIVLDLNKLQDINDTLGYEKGDIQIQSVANVLIKTQLDNTDIIRTDGNEFLIYLVGYEVKQITSYIHKLNKDFKKLPYDYGVTIGYSMITDGVKSVEDAINEAVEQVKAQKEEKKDE